MRCGLEPHSASASSFTCTYEQWNAVSELWSLPHPALLTGPSARTPRPPLPVALLIFFEPIALPCPFFLCSTTAALTDLTVMLISLTDEQIKREMSEITSVRQRRAHGGRKISEARLRASREIGEEDLGGRIES